MKVRTANRSGALARVSSTAARALRFSQERDPFTLTPFIQLRIIDPEAAHWRRSVETATRWLRETGSVEPRVPYVFVAPEEWGVGGYPLGRWLADVRRSYAAGTLEAKRVVELEALAMVWSAWDTAWADGLAVAQDYAAVHGHLVPPVTAVWGGDGVALGVRLKNQRAATRKTVRTPNGARTERPQYLRPESYQRAVWKRWTRSTRPGAPPGTSTDNAASI
ncbi:helicase associated domain-containing protein [Streptomyces sp. NPDC002935]|uniref:helicase associated domain-containing protein n=1 Tax=Streptomyces sp. NPDC002935 TaxID=3154545 RepID=UPI0033BEEDCB